MKPETKANLIAYPLAIVAFGATLAVGLWLVLSVITSFAALEWRPVTATSGGRLVLAVGWTLLMLKGAAKLFSEDE